MKGTISTKQQSIKLEFDRTEWSYLKSIISFARKAANGPLFANDVESPKIETLARQILDELEFEKVD